MAEDEIGLQNAVQASSVKFNAGACQENVWIRKAPVDFSDRVVAAQRGMHSTMAVRSSRYSPCKKLYAMHDSRTSAPLRPGHTLFSSGLLGGVCSSRGHLHCGDRGIAPLEATESDTSVGGSPHLDIVPRENEEVSVLDSHKRLALLKAEKSCSVAIEELDKPIGTYMTLPASQYSVLDARKIERIDEDTFKCYVGGFKFMSFVVEPVLTLSVVVGDRGPTVRLLETELEGSKAALEANRKFTATMQNVVQWEEDEIGGKCISSDTTLEVTLEVPGWFVFPVSVVERSGSAVMRKVLETAVPRFLKQLESDYVLWSQGEDRL